MDDEKIKIPVYFEVRNYDNLLNRLNKLSEIQDKLSSATFGDSIAQMTTDMQKLSNALNGISTKVDNVQKAFDNTSLKSLDEGIKDNGTKIQQVLDKIGISSKDANKHLNKSIGFAKKLGYALLTVRGIWFAIRKSMSSYISQNEELQSKMNALYYSVGSLFAPVLEWMVDQLIEIVAYVNEFVKALGSAGINMSNLEKNTKKANKALATFDELTNISQDNESGFKNPFESIVINDKIVSFLNEVAEVGKKAFEVVKSIFTTISGSIGIKFDNVSFEASDFTPQVASALTKMLGFAIAFKLGQGMLGKLALAVGLTTVISFTEAIVNNDKNILSEELLKTALAGILGIAVGALLGSVKAGFYATIGLKLLLDVVFGNKDKIKNSTAIVDSIPSVVKTPVVVKPPTTTPSYAGSVVNFEKKQVLASYDVGTNYVPNDQLAYVHKGEAIIPAKYNDGMYGNGNVVAKLEQLIEVVDSKEFKAYISQSDIGKASLGYINQQNKIIGGGLI